MIPQMRIIEKTLFSELKTGVGQLLSIYDPTAKRHNRGAFFDVGPHPAIVVSVPEIFVGLS